MKDPERLPKSQEDTPKKHRREKIASHKRNRTTLGLEVQVNHEIIQQGIVAFKKKEETTGYTNT